mgnify:CR=1 FL=1
MTLSILLQAAGGFDPQILMFPLLLIVAYFFLIRPQHRRQKEEKKFREQIAKGMRIVTNGGIHGKILDLQETTLTIESENSRLKIEKSAISKELSMAYQVQKEKDKESKK